MREGLSALVGLGCQLWRSRAALQACSGIGGEEM